MGANAHSISDSVQASDFFLGLQAPIVHSWSVMRKSSFPLLLYNSYPSSVKEVTLLYKATCFRRIRLHAHPQEMNHTCLSQSKYGCYWHSRQNILCCVGLFHTFKLV